MKTRIQIVVGLASLVLAAVLYGIGAIRYDLAVGTADVRIFPAGFFALLGGILLVRSLLYGERRLMSRRSVDRASAD